MVRPGNLKLSNSQPPQDKPATYSQSYQSLAQGEDGNLPEKGRTVAALPPFPVLLEWLEYYHNQTGSWPEPEFFKNIATAPEVPAPSTVSCGVEKPFLTLVPDLTSNKTFNITSASSSGKGTSPDSNTKHPEKNGQEKFNFDWATGYDLPSSVYYRVALELIQKQDALTPGKGSLNVREETVLTFASFLAWCHYPPFRAANNTAVAGMSMYLPLDQWSKILKIRKATLSEVIKELEAVGLVEIHDTGKRGTRSYHLAKPLPRSLPVFGPIQLEDRLELQVKAGELEVIEFPTPGTAPEAELGYMNHVDNYKINNLKPKNHEHGGRVEQGITEEKFEFLVQVASFPGYTSPDSLITLDKREALKFAAEPRLDITTIKRIYRQTLSAWSAGKCTKNPIGFFHHSLKRNLLQNTVESKSTADFATPTSTGNAAGTGSSQINSSRFPKETLHNKSEKKVYTGRVMAQQAAFPLSDRELEEETSSGLENDYSNVIQEINGEEVVNKLQAQVLEALQNRFKQAPLAEILSQLQWGITLSANKLRLELVNPGSNFLALATLGQSELSLLKIALSQSLRTLTGKSFEVEISVA